jgi:hypothetical protein
MIFHFNTDEEFKYSIRIPWKMGDTVTNWDETCAWAVEKFGLPGDKFITHPTLEYMDFFFKDRDDAIHFSLVWQ